MNLEVDFIQPLFYFHNLKIIIIKIKKLLALELTSKIILLIVEKIGGIKYENKKKKA